LLYLWRDAAEVEKVPGESGNALGAVTASATPASLLTS
jgi:hypothetical protein